MVTCLCRTGKTHQTRDPHRPYRATRDRNKASGSEDDVPFVFPKHPADFPQPPPFAGRVDSIDGVVGVRVRGVVASVDGVEAGEQSGGGVVETGSHEEDAGFSGRTLLRTQPAVAVGGGTTDTGGRISHKTVIVLRGELPASS